jgi:hypothetical protein
MLFFANTSFAQTAKIDSSKYPQPVAIYSPTGS